MEILKGVFSIIALCILYFIPTIASIQNNNKDKQSIGIVNFFLGWTLIGWVFCLAWAYKK